MKILIDGTIYNESAWRLIACRDGALRIEWADDCPSFEDAGFAQKQDIIEAVLDAFEREKVFKPPTVLFRAAIKSLSKIIDERFHNGERCYIVGGLDATKIQCVVGGDVAHRVDVLLRDARDDRDRDEHLDPPRFTVDMRRRASNWTLCVDGEYGERTVIAFGPMPALDVRAVGALSPALVSHPPSREVMNNSACRAIEAAEVALVLYESELRNENAKSDEDEDA